MLDPGCVVELPELVTAPPSEPGASGELTASAATNLLPVLTARPGLFDRVRDALPLVRRLAVLAVMLTLVLSFGRSSVADQYHVPTSSMAPTITPGDRIFVNKLAYGLRLPFTNSYLVERESPHAGDVVVFADPRGGPVPLVKRVVAVAGQTVAVHRGVLFIDGVPQRLEVLADGQILEHLGPGAHGAGSLVLAAFGPVVVPPEHFFVMGDNRAASLDSREMGAIPRELVRGRVVGVTYHRDNTGISSDRMLQAIDARPTPLPAQGFLGLSL